MTSPSKPTILLIGGALQPATFLEPLQSAFTALSFPTLIPSLPTCTPLPATESSKKTVLDDVSAVMAVLEPLILKEHKTVVLLAHSYGGQVLTSLPVKDLEVSVRKGKGLPGGVLCFVWCAAAAVPEGMSIRDISGGVVGEPYKFLDDGTYTIPTPIASALLLSSLPSTSTPSRADYESQLIPQSQLVFEHKCPDAAWKYIPSIWVIGLQDKVIPVEFQEKSAEMVGAKKVVRMEVDHGLHLAVPGDIARAVGEAVEGF